jgi:hypothetical protein
MLIKISLAIVIKANEQSVGLITPVARLGYCWLLVAVWFIGDIMRTHKQHKRGPRVAEGSAGRVK